MKEHYNLKKSILLCWENDKEKFKRTFTIVKKLSEETSAIYYEAYSENGKKGILKEFYPKGFALERDKNGQLFPFRESEDRKEKFQKAKQEYLEPYNMLLEEKKKGNEPELVTFIPEFEIYYGCDETYNKIGSVYIWMHKSNVETFDKICEEIHKHPEVSPEHKLVTVLYAIENLTKSIYALHRVDILHRDIKPSNFGFLKRGDETLTQAFSMIHIDSVCSIYHSSNEIVGTEGYLEPEVAQEELTYQTDIYAIGAMLFHAIIVSDELKEGKYLYKSEHYDRLHELISNSKLIQASEANAHPRLRNILSVILQKCLCERANRYANCEELLEDLQTALYYALPSDIARKNRLREKWVLTDIEKSLDKNKEKNSTLAIQYHLYQYPLYQWLDEKENIINILVIGFGNYGQKFLDICLQAGQIRDKILNVTVVSDNDTDKEIYLSERPELSEFFNIDGSLDYCEDIYGNITFETTELAREDQKANTDILQNIMYEHYEIKRPHYVFVALGEDKLNLAAAKACKLAVEVFEINCVVHYVCENKHSSGEKIEDLYPIYVNEDVKKSELYPEIERMAFNTHLIWEKNLNINFQTVRANFRKAYNHDACISSVLSLKYKLYSIGIDLDKCNFTAAAKAFVEKDLSTTEKNLTIKNELIWIEHRRWVTEKLCLGWSKTQHLEDCLNGMTKDEKKKQHICIVRSRPDQELAVKYRKNNFEKWEKPSNSSNDILDKLDELDQISVKLHRLFVEKAKVVKEKNLLNGNSMAGIRALIEGNKKAIVAFQEWFACLKDIWNGDRDKVPLYKGLKNAFLNTTDTISKKSQKLVREQVKAFEVIFYPILASMEYRDWKQDDVAFIDNIPFILTYTENVYMVIPYAMGDNTQVFGNVAAPTVVNPARILYLCLLESRQEVKQLQETIPYLMEYMRKKQVKSTVELIVISSDALSSILNENFKKEVLQLGKGRIRQIKYIQLGEMEELTANLENYLKHRCNKKKVFAVEKNTTRLSYLLQGAGFYNSFSNYQFDSKDMKFYSLVGCDLFGYIKKFPYITVSDMAAFKLSSSESSNQPEFFEDYKELWERYSEKSSVWKSLCELLGEHAEKQDVLVSFEKKQDYKNSKKVQEYTYILPFMCSKSATKIVNFLKEQDIIEQKSKVNGYTTDSCKIIIIDHYGYKLKYDKLFSNVYALMIPNAITLYTKGKDVFVKFDNLIVSKVKIPEKFSEKRKEEIEKLINYFVGKGYIINLYTAPDGKMSFTYATRQIKELLTTAGKMLEVHTYHKVKECGRFDDVVSSFEIDWEETEVKNEFDCIITKGFCTLFVECKARFDIKQEFYFKLASLAEQFGINATAVLIADTQEEKSFYDNAPINTMQRKRGNMMNIVTVWKPNEINNIGHTLLNIINGTYVSKEE